LNEIGKESDEAAKKNELSVVGTAIQREKSSKTRFNDLRAKESLAYKQGFKSLASFENGKPERYGTLATTTALNSQSSIEKERSTLVKV